MCSGRPRGSRLGRQDNVRSRFDVVVESLSGVCRWDPGPRFLLWSFLSPVLSSPFASSFNPIFFKAVLRCHRPGYSHEIEFMMMSLSSSLLKTGTWLCFGGTRCVFFHGQCSAVRWCHLFSSRGVHNRSRIGWYH